MKLLSAVLFAGMLSCLAFPINAAPQRAVIFVPGVYGSILKDQSGEVYWVSIRKMLFGSASIHLCHDFMSGDCPKLVQGGILRDISLMGLYNIDAYGSAIDAVKEITSTEAHFSAFPYDWRQDLITTSYRLGELIQKLRLQYPRVDVIAHSMGGLVLSYYLLCQDQPLEKCRPSTQGSLIDRAVIVGTPFGGTATTFVNMLKGRKFARNSSMMMAHSYGSFPSIFQMLPFGRKKILNSKKDSMMASVGQVDKWQNEKWGVFSAPKLITNTDRAREFVQNSLDRSEDLHRLLDTPLFTKTGATKPRVLIVQGKGNPTPDTVEWLEGTKLGQRQQSDGDDSVLFESSAPPKSLAGAMDVQTFETTNKHQEMFLDNAVVKEIAKFLSLGGK